MELITCRNCLAVYGDAQSECPLCGADRQGQGAEVELDGPTRAAVGDLGGLFGAILEAGRGAWLLWCSRGVCRFDDDGGLQWTVRTRSSVDSVRLEGESVELTTERGAARIWFEDGSQVLD